MLELRKADRFLKPCTQVHGWETPAIREGSGGADARDLSRGVWHPRIRCKNARGRTDSLVLHTV